MHPSTLEFFGERMSVARAEAPAVLILVTFLPGKMASISEFSVEKREIRKSIF
jgi:hypothetical protein